MRAIVTGGAGFIGSHLVDRLVADGHDVTVIDNLRTGRRSNLEEALRTGHATLVQLDIATSTNEMTALFRDCNAVFHLAALVDPALSTERPDDYFRANVDGTFAVVEAARLAGVPRVIFAALVSDEAQNPYALTKMLGEQIVAHWGQIYGIATTSLRLSNVGETQTRDSSFVGDVVEAFVVAATALENGASPEAVGSAR